MIIDLLIIFTRPFYTLCQQLSIKQIFILNRLEKKSDWKQISKAGKSVGVDVNIKTDCSPLPSTLYLLYHIIVTLNK